MYNSAGFFSPSPSIPGQSPTVSPNSSTIRTFAIIYALISILTLSWGLFNYHRRLYLIKTKYAGDFSEFLFQSAKRERLSYERFLLISILGDLIGPPIICLVLFVAVLVNFIVRGESNLAHKPYTVSSFLIVTYLLIPGSQSRNTISTTKIKVMQFLILEKVLYNANTYSQRNVPTETP